MDTIDKQWIEETHNLADLFENGEASISRFTNDQLQWLIYWNFGYSGITLTEQTKLAMKELEARGKPYSEKEADTIDTLVNKFC